LRVKSSHFDGLVRTTLTAYRIGIANRIFLQNSSHVALENTIKSRIKSETRFFFLGKVANDAGFLRTAENGGAPG